METQVAKYYRIRLTQIYHTALLVRESSLRRKCHHSDLYVSINDGNVLQFTGSTEHISSIKQRQII